MEKQKLALSQAIGEGGGGRVDRAMSVSSDGIGSNVSSAATTPRTREARARAEVERLREQERLRRENEEYLRKQQEALDKAKEEQQRRAQELASASASSSTVHPVAAAAAAAQQFLKPKQKVMHQKANTLKEVWGDLKDREHVHRKQKHLAQTQGAPVVFLLRLKLKRAIQALQKRKPIIN